MFQHDKTTTPRPATVWWPICWRKRSGRAVSWRGRTGAADGVSRARETTATSLCSVSCFYHNRQRRHPQGEVVAAAEEDGSLDQERRRFPAQGCQLLPREGRHPSGDVDAVVYYDDTPKTFERLLHSLALGEKGDELWQRTMPSWMRHSCGCRASSARR